MNGRGKFRVVIKVLDFVVVVRDLEPRYYEWTLHFKGLV